MLQDEAGAEGGPVRDAVADFAEEQRAFGLHFDGGTGGSPAGQAQAHPASGDIDDPTVDRRQARAEQCRKYRLCRLEAMFLAAVHTGAYRHGLLKM